MNTPNVDVRAIEDAAAQSRPFKDRQGIEGRIVVRESPYATMGPKRKVYFEPTAKGREHPAYRETRRKLGDHWDTDVSSSESWGEYMMRAGRCWRGGKR